MRTFFLFTLTIISNPLFLRGQDIKMQSIPHTMHFENKVLDYKVVSGNQVKIVAPANTDLFISPDGGFETNQSPRLLFKPDSDFILTAKISPEFISTWDAGALIVYNDSNHYAKFCFENDFKNQPRIVSVVCNEVCDDCNSMPITGKEVFYRIIGSSKSNSFGFYFSEDGEVWFPVRRFRLNKINNLQIGFSAQSPKGEKCSVDFSEIDFQNRKPKSYWQGD